MNEQNLKLLKGEIEFYKTLKSNGGKAVKTKKKEQVVHQNLNPNVDADCNLNQN